MRALLIASLALVIPSEEAARQPAALRPGASSHVTVVTSTRPSAGGEKTISLYVDVTPKADIHVYAPGADDYQPIKVTIDSQPGVTAGPLRYPKSELLVNEFERVPVFQKPFRLVQEVAVDRGSPAAGRRRLTIKGTVAFQACDNDVCFKPESLPVVWDVVLK